MRRVAEVGRLVEQFVRGDGQELHEVVVQGDPLEDLTGVVEPPGRLAALQTLICFNFPSWPLRTISHAR